MKIGQAEVSGDNDVNRNEAHAESTDVDLEDALDLAGAGLYQLFHCSLMIFTILASILEMMGFAFILPAAACDLDVPDNLRGVITSIPNIGIILTAPFWGRAADSWGRKPVLLGTLAASGVLGILAAFMPTLLTYALCKFAASLFLSVPSSLGYAYASELVPRKRRDSAVIVINGLVTLLTVLSSALAWGILSYDWQFELGGISMRPWRLLTAVYSLPLVLTAVMMISARESPKFLLAKGKDTEALEVIRHIYAVNSRKPKYSFCVRSLKTEDTRASIDQSSSSEALEPKGRSESALALLRPPHLKWFALTGFLMFGLYSFLHGLFLFAPDTINTMMTGSEDRVTVCDLLNISDDSSSTSECDDSISHNTLLIMTVTTLLYGTLVTGASASPFSKKTLLVAMFVIVGVGCLVAGLTTNRILVGIAMSSLQITAFGIGPLNAYVVHLFPTTLRGTAVGAVMMLGRVGSVAGANAAGYFLSVACAPTFYGFSLLVFLCAGLSFLLPADNVPSSSVDDLDKQS